MGSTTVQTDGQGLQLASNASTTNDLTPLGPNAQALDQQTHPGDSDYQILPTDRYVSTNAALTGNWVWTLPAANSVTVGFQVTVADAFGACNLTTYLTVPPLGTDRINQRASAQIVNSPYAFVKVRSDGVSNWTVVDRFPLSGTPVGDVDYQILASDSYVYSTTALASSAPRVWTLPSAASAGIGWQITVADQAGVVISATSNRYIQINLSGSDTVNRLAGVQPQMLTPNAFISFRSDGISDWSVTSFHPDNPPHDINDKSPTGTFDGVQVIKSLSAQNLLGYYTVEQEVDLSLSNGRNDNVSTSSTYERVSGPSAVFSISGLAVPSVVDKTHTTVTDGIVLDINNPTSFVMTLLHQNANSTAANRIVTATAADTAVAAGGTARLIYNASLSRWTVQNVYDGTGLSTALTSAHLLVGNTSNVATDRAVSGDATLSFTGAATVTGWQGIPLGAAITAATAQSIPRSTGSAWTADIAASGGNSWTPVLTQSNTPTFTQNNATYIQIGKLVFGWCRLTPTQAGTTNNAITVTVPVTATTATLSVGSGFVTLAGTQYRVVALLSTTGLFAFRRADVTGTSQLGVDPNAALANSGDTINFFFMYEAA